MPQAVTRKSQQLIVLKRFSSAFVLLMLNAHAEFNRLFCLLFLPRNTYLDPVKPDCMIFNPWLPKPLVGGSNPSRRAIASR